MNKSATTNLIAGLLLMIAFWLPESTNQVILQQASLFALSGALTNWIAVHMLFEKIPFLYGSGIIPNRFEEFKVGIYILIMDNFFTEENFKQLTKQSIPQELPLDQIASQIDYEQLFSGFITVVKQSSFGGMLAMVGGEEALEPLREPFQKEFQAQFTSLIEKIDISAFLSTEQDFQKLKSQVEQLVNQRLNELTPQKVKEIIQEMIHKHLGWLVVWGGIFGAMLGTISAILL